MVNGDIFAGGKMLGGTVVDYLWKTIWGGKPEWDCLGELRDCGMNWVRVGVTTCRDPLLADTPLEQWGSLEKKRGWSALEYAEAILRDAQEKGLRKNLFFFLSDKAASGAQQPAPPEWGGLSVEETAEKLGCYCRETTRYFLDQGLIIDLYDLGNEIERGIAGFFLGDRIQIPEGVDIQKDIKWMRDNVWKTEAVLLTAAAEGVRQADSNAKINLHGSCFALGAGNRLLKGFYQAMADFGVPYDVAGVSYYWDTVHIYDHGTLAAEKESSDEAYFKTAECREFVEFITHTLGKRFLFSEFVYPCYRPENRRAGEDIGYPYTPQGQADWMRDFLKTVMETPEISGCIYFYPEYSPRFHDKRYDVLNACGLFREDYTPNDALLQYRAYR